MYTLPEIRYTSRLHTSRQIYVCVFASSFCNWTVSDQLFKFEVIKNERALSNGAIWSDATSEVLGSASPDFPCKDVRVHRVQHAGHRATRCQRHPHAAARRLTPFHHRAG